MLPERGEAGRRTLKEISDLGELVPRWELADKGWIRDRGEDGIWRGECCGFGEGGGLALGLLKLGEIYPFCYFDFKMPATLHLEFLFLF